ncbi:OmpA family protein [Sphingomonas sp. LY160]|uniref:OmpA family protein n=1 Tax=Sphingomonas sp. LY160 TaxID=3095342 RepID=UPI002ADEDBA8|nr:OmpA family protein [Sphingomonas sp. LY160]MEA1072637.1 OmpA family protein [Sphingomonas sp. LY160]
MRRITMLTGFAMTGAMLVTACTTNPYTGRREISRTAIGAIGGALGGYLVGDLVGGRGDRTEKILGAGIGAIAGGAVGAYMDRQEADLRRQTAGTGVDVIRQGDDLILRMPSGITFAVDRYDVQPGARSTLDEVARTLSSYNQTYVDVLGHTDSDGSDAYNQGLSERRANAVADYLSSRGVARARMGVRGFGETAPIASNATIEGKAQNRRVEIKIVPVTQPGY